MLFRSRSENVAYATMMKRAKAASKMADDGNLEALDNKKNDVIPAMLSEGEAVIPRSIMLAEDSPEKAKKFIKALQERKSPKEAKHEALKDKSRLERIAELKAELKKLGA